MNDKTHITTAALRFRYDMEACPGGAKCLLLTWGGVCVIGPITNASRKYYAGWAPMPQRDKEEEVRRGLVI